MHGFDNLCFRHTSKPLYDSIHDCRIICMKEWIDFRFCRKELISCSITHIDFFTVDRAEIDIAAVSQQKYEYTRADQQMKEPQSE